MTASDKSTKGRSSRAPSARQDRESDGISTATLVKWFIPSVTALFAVVGYIVQSAQQDLLGLRYSSDRDTNAFFLTAADFFRDVIAVPARMIMRLFEGESISLGGYGWELWLATLLLIVAVVLPRISRFQRLPVLLPVTVALLVIVAGKFVLMDEPLFQVRNVILGTAVEPLLGDELGRTFIDRLAAKRQGEAPGTDQGGNSSADILAASIVCSRVSLTAASRDKQLQVHDLCQKENEYYARELRGSFLAQLWAASLVLALSLTILRSSAKSQLHILLAFVALAYTLIVPYAYGKLQKSTFFDFGLVRLAAPLQEEDQEASSSSLHALTLSRSAAGTTLLVAVRGPCGNVEGAEYSQVTLSSLSPSQVLAVERIYRQDVIAWAALNERRCPPIAI